MEFAFIISEYNPFHRGHEYMVQCIREKLGEVTIIAIMSTSFVQRGEPAVFPAEIRARAAVECGVDLVISLPVPYSMSGGSYFAKAGVRIASCFGGDKKYLVFGSESGNIESIKKIAANMSDSKYKDALSARSMDEPYAEAVVRVYTELFGEIDRTFLSQPNNILGIEYLRAINEENSDLIPYTIKRTGSGYNDDSTDGEFLSATALRKLILNGEYEEFYSKVPSGAISIYKEAIEKGNYSTGWNGVSDGVITFLRLTDGDTISECAEMSGGLDRRILSASYTAKDVDELFDSVATKRFTNARIRRALLSALLSVRESDITVRPEYSMVLGADERGVAALRTVDGERLCLITKPSTLDIQSRVGKLFLASESLYGMSLQNKRGTFDFMKITPYIKK